MERYVFKGYADNAKIAEVYAVEKAMDFAAEQASKERVLPLNDERFLTRDKGQYCYEIALTY